MSHLPFAPSVYRDRVARLQRGLAEAGLDALLVTTPPDLLYLTGFLTRFWESPARPWFVVVPARGDAVAVIPEIGVDLMARSVIPRIESWPAPDPAEDGAGPLAEVITSLVPDGGSVGTPMGAETHLRLPLAAWARLSGMLGARRIVDGTRLLHALREIKSEEEIALLRACCALTARAFDRLPALLHPGLPLSEAFRRFQIALLEEGADWVAYLAGGAGPGGYGDVISPAADRPLQRGDVLMLDTGAVRRGYYSDFDRNFAIGPPDPLTMRTHAALHDATEAALSALRPGMTAAAAHALMADALRARGAVPAGGRFGHGLGLALTEWPSLDPRDQTVLRAGMVLTLEPAAVMAPGRMLVHEEVIVLRAEGPECLSPRAPDRLPVIPA